MLKTKTLSTKAVKDVDVKQGIVAGYLSAFDFLDSDNEVIAKGSFLKTIQEDGISGKDRIKFLREHDLNKPIGKFTELKEDNFGLYFVARLNKTREGLDALALYENGELFEHSIGFVPIKYEVSNDDNKVVTFTEVKLWEGSAVLWGANEMAKLTELKSKLQNIQKIGSLSDEILQAVEQVLNKKSEEEKINQQILNIFQVWTKF